MSQTGLFIWKGQINNFINYDERKKCPCCQTATDKYNMVDYDKLYAEDEVDDIYECSLCGWYYRHTALVRDPSERPYFTGGSRSPILCEFSAKSLVEPMKEIVARLNAGPENRGCFEWAEYETVVTETLTRRGFKIMGSLISADSQTYVMVIDLDSDVMMLQCKRKEKKQGAVVSAIRILAGVSIDWNACMASLVMTADFASLEESYLDKFQSNKLTTTLAQATDLLKLLGAYGQDFPSLDRMIPEYREARIRRHRARGTPRNHAIYPL